MLSEAAMAHQWKGAAAKSIYCLRVEDSVPEFLSLALLVFGATSSSAVTVVIAVWLAASRVSTS